MSDPVAAAEARLSRERVTQICAAMVDISSPTGEEGPLARHLAAEMRAAGLDGDVQVIDGTGASGGDMANAHGRIGGRSGHPALLLYAPLDTVTVGDADHDLPWVGPELRDDMLSQAEVRDDLVIGLGAQNPKGHGACVLAAAEAIAAAELELDGDLLVGFGAGGMPSNGRRPDLSDGHGVGCAHLVERLRPDEAVIAKTGWSISWEEVGLVWFTVEVDGTHTYVGSRHLLPYRNAIAAASHIVIGLEHWFTIWAEERRSGLVAPQGVVAAIEGGWPHMAAFTSAACRFHVDLRLSPRTTPEEAAADFEAEVVRLAAEVGADARVARTVTIPGTTTDPDEPIIRSSIACWEALTGRRHEPVTGLSGATDANILRGLGVPTARVGLPKVLRDDLDVDFQLGMNAVDVDDMMALSRLLIRIALDRCGVVGQRAAGEAR
jgi:acetylornithine deacetylase/succinyl-diaminopimelate desuccinylase-like protein